MSDVRLIDANALKTEIENIDKEYLLDCCDTYEEIFDEIIKLINNAPTVKSSETDYLDGWDGEYYGEDC